MFLVYCFLLGAIGLFIQKGYQYYRTKAPNKAPEPPKIEEQVNEAPSKRELHLGDTVVVDNMNLNCHGRIGKLTGRQDVFWDVYLDGTDPPMTVRSLHCSSIKWVKSPEPEVDKELPKKEFKANSMFKDGGRVLVVNSKSEYHGRRGTIVGLVGYDTLEVDLDGIEKRRVRATFKSLLPLLQPNDRICIDSSHSDAGRKGQVIRVTNGAVWEVILDKTADLLGKHGAYHENFLIKLPEKEEPPKQQFKIGDPVIIIEKGSLRCGRKGKISRSWACGYWDIDLEATESERPMRMNYVSPDWLKLDEAPKVEPIKFKVGDPVIIVRKDSKHVNRKGTLTEQYGDCWDVELLAFDKTERTTLCYLTADWFKLYEAPKEDYRNGDLVIVDNPNSDFHNRRGKLIGPVRAYCWDVKLDETPHEKARTVALYTHSFRRLLTPDTDIKGLQEKGVLSKAVCEFRPIDPPVSGNPYEESKIGKNPCAEIKLEKEIKVGDTVITDDPQSHWHNRKGRVFEERSKDYWAVDLFETTDKKAERIYSLSKWLKPVDEFQAGDLVIVTNTESASFGQKGTLESAVSVGRWHINLPATDKFPASKDRHVPTSWFSHCTPDDQSNNSAPLIKKKDYEVGDMVIITDKDSPHFNKKGKLATETSPYRWDIQLEPASDGHVLYSYPQAHFAYDELANKPEFKAGDRVMITDAYATYMGRTGKLERQTSFDPNRWSIVLDPKGNEIPVLYHIPTSWFKLAPDDLMPGDFVKVIAPDSTFYHRIGKLVKRDQNLTSHWHIDLAPIASDPLGAKKVVMTKEWLFRTSLRQGDRIRVNGDSPAHRYRTGTLGANVSEGIWEVSLDGLPVPDVQKINDAWLTRMA